VLVNLIRRSFATQLSQESQEQASKRLQADVNEIKQMLLWLTNGRSPVVDTDTLAPSRNPSLM